MELSITCPLQLQKHEELIISNVFERNSPLSDQSKQNLLPFLLAAIRSGESVGSARTSADIYHTLFTGAIERYMKEQEAMIAFQQERSRQQIDKKKAVLIAVTASLITATLTVVAGVASLYS